MGNLLAGESTECVRAAEWTITNLQMDERTQDKEQESSRSRSRSRTEIRS